MTLPNFLLIGAAKSGTTSLYQYLRRHPQIFLSPVKEPSFFAHDGTPQRLGEEWQNWARHNIVTNLTDYEALFDGAESYAVIGEASPAYLSQPQAAQRIHATIPHARLAAILRQPVERAYSAYMMAQLYSEGDRLDFAAFVRKRLAALPPQGPIEGGRRDASLYARHLQRYYDLFPRRQLYMMLYDDLKADPAALLRGLFTFLEVDAGFQPDLSQRFMTGGAPRSKAWKFLLRQINRVKPVLRGWIPSAWHLPLLKRWNALQRRGLEKAPPIDPDTRRALLDYYREDTLRLQDLLQRDLSAWLE